MKRMTAVILAAMVLAPPLTAAGTAQKVTRILALKHFRVELSAGVGLDRSTGLPERGTGADALLHQYAEALGATMAQEGRIGENFTGLPFRAAIAYRLDHYWAVKAGLGFFSGGVSSVKDYALDLQSGQESYNLDLRNRLSLVSPFLEIERTFGRFSVFAGLGMQWGRLKHTLGLDSALSGVTSRLTEEITASGSGPMGYLGGAYQVPLGDRFSLLMRLEIRLARINRWQGNKRVEESDSLGNRREETVSGDLMRFEWNPYGAGWVSSWDLGDIAGDDSLYRGLSTLSSNFSGIRFTLGVTF